MRPSIISLWTVSPGGFWQTKRVTLLTTCGVSQLSSTHCGADVLSHPLPQQTSGQHSPSLMFAGECSSMYGGYGGVFEVDDDAVARFAVSATLGPRLAGVGQRSDGGRAGGEGG